MADLTITAANVLAGSGATIRAGTSGATITAGQSIYIDSNSKIQLADADAQTTAAAKGIALNGASANQPIDYCSGGDLNLGATLTVGQVYAVSTTAGGIAPVSDLGSGDWPTILGIADAADNLVVNIQAGGAAKA